jgi:hypothetical protein
MPYKDPIKQKEAKRQWYLKNKELTIKRSMAHKHRDQEWFKSIKSTKSCVECGESRYELLDFHHIDPSTKITTVSDMLGRYGRSKILDEMAKCEILCKSCHMKHHYNYPFH